jgi:hypothetical protein
MLIKFTILLLQINTNITTTIKKKIETIFYFYFIFSSTILINDLNEFFYLISIKDNEIMLKRKVIKAMHKTTFNKISKINNIINRTLRQLIRIVLF